MKSAEKPFFCQICVIFLRKMVHVVIDRHFSLCLEGLKIFLYPRLSLIVPLTGPFTKIWTFSSLRIDLVGKSIKITLN